jgi:hypothetical protein
MERYGRKREDRANGKKEEEEREVWERRGKEGERAVCK